MLLFRHIIYVEIEPGTSNIIIAIITIITSILPLSAAQIIHSKSSTHILSNLYPHYLFQSSNYSILHQVPILVGTNIAHYYKPHGR